MVGLLISWRIRIYEIDVDSGQIQVLRSHVTYSPMLLSSASKWAGDLVPCSYPRQHELISKQYSRRR
jgi:hypothetical protein